MNTSVDPVILRRKLQEIEELKGDAVSALKVYDILEGLKTEYEESWSQQLEIKSLVNHVLMNMFDLVPEPDDKVKFLTNVLPVSIVYRHAHSSFSHRFKFLLAIQFEGENYVVNLMRKREASLLSTKRSRYVYIPAPCVEIHPKLLPSLKADAKDHDLENLMVIIGRIIKSFSKHCLELSRNIPTPVSELEIDMEEMDNFLSESAAQSTQTSALPGEPLGDSTEQQR